jgi:serine/threonine protein kinase
MTVQSRRDPPSTSAAFSTKSGSIPADDALIGAVINERFQIVSPIARGGMGAVYMAEEARLGRRVAVKILSPVHDVSKDPEFLRRFLREAATVAKLTHPNTVTVFDYGHAVLGRPDAGDPAAQSVHYIVMELVNGRTLTKALRQDRVFSPMRVIHITKQICRSLREAHHLGVIHRDIKPSNVMLVDRDGEDFVKVVDFGLVKPVDTKDLEEITQAGTFMGSPKYMAPEQIQGERVDGRCDIYAVGIIMYEMLTGRVPFERANSMRVLMDHLREPPPPIGVRGVPPELQAIVFRCLEKDRDARFPDMRALLSALGAGAETSGAQPVEDPRVAAAIRASTPPAGLARSSSGAPSVAANASVFPRAPVTSSATSSSPRMAGGAPLQRWRAPLVALVVAVLVGVLLASSDALMAAVTPSAPLVTVVPIASSAEPTTEVAPGTTSERAARAPSTGIASPAPGRVLAVELQSSPPGAMVRVAGAEYGPTPAHIELRGAHTADGTDVAFVFEREGYAPRTITRTVHGPRLEINAHLSALPVERASEDAVETTTAATGTARVRSAGLATTGARAAGRRAEPQETRAAGAATRESESESPSADRAPATAEAAEEPPADEVWRRRSDTRDPWGQ